MVLGSQYLSRVTYLLVPRPFLEVACIAQILTRVEMSKLAGYVLPLKNRTNADTTYLIDSTCPRAVNP